MANWKPYLCERRADGDATSSLMRTVGAGGHPGHLKRLRITVGEGTADQPGTMASRLVLPAGERWDTGCVVVSESARVASLGLTRRPSAHSAYAPRTGALAIWSAFDTLSAPGTNGFQANGFQVNGIEATAVTIPDVDMIHSPLGRMR